MTYAFVDEPQPQAQTSGGFIDTAKAVGRTAARIPINLLSLATGSVGDVASLANEYIARPIVEKLTDQPSLPYEQTTLGQYLPTSQQEKERLTPDFLKPQSSGEELIDTIIEDTALLYSPIKTKVPFVKSYRGLKAFATSVGSNLVGEFVKDATGGDLEKSSYAKLGTMFLATIADKANAPKLVGQLYRDAEALLPSGVRVGAKNLTNKLNGLVRKLSQGTKAPSEQFVINEANAILKKIQKGTITVEEAWASKRSLGEKLEDFLYKSSDAKANARARKLATQINQELKETINTYGNQNKAFGQAFKNAEEAYGAVQGSNFVTRWIGNNLKYNPLTAGLAKLVTGGIGTTVGSATVVYPAAKLLYRVFKSPVLRKYYTKAIGSAAKQNAVQFNRDLKRLDKAIQDDAAKDTYQFVD